MLRRVVLAALLVLGWFSADAQAHALLAKELASGDARVVAFSYSTGDVAAYAEAKLYGPDSADVEFQNGRTDAQGRFAFLPDKPGTWTIVVADNMGHKVSHHAFRWRYGGTRGRPVRIQRIAVGLAGPVPGGAWREPAFEPVPRAGPVPASCGEAGLGMRFCIRRSGTVISRQGIGLI